MAEPIVTESVSGIEKRNSNSANQSFNQLLLIVSIGGVILWLAPPVRVIAAIPLLLIGKLFQSAGESMNQIATSQPSERLMNAATASGSSEWSWLFGFFLLALPFLLYRASYIQGWLQGTKDASDEWKEFSRIRHH